MLCGNRTQICKCVRDVVKMVAYRCASERGSPPNGAAPTTLSHEKDTIAQLLWVNCATLSGSAAFKWTMRVRTVTSPHIGVQPKVTQQRRALPSRFAFVGCPVHALIKYMTLRNAAMQLLQR